MDVNEEVSGSCVPFDDVPVRTKYNRHLDAVRVHFEKKGYDALSGLQYGCDFVLYPVKGVGKGGIPGKSGRGGVGNVHR